MLIDDETPWVRDYRGLWGLDTRDRFGGERAPSGPRYERDGSVRPSWSNPLGWAGLQKVPPSDGDLAQLVAHRVAHLDEELDALDAAIAADRESLRRLRAEAVSLATHEYARALAETRRLEVAGREAALDESIAARTRLAEERRTHLDTLSRPIPAEPPQAHLRHRHLPRMEEQERRTRFLRFWSVVSTPLLIASLILLVTSHPAEYLATIAALILLFLGVEAIARRRFLSFVASAVLLVMVVVAGVALVVGFVRYWQLTLSVVLGIVAVALLLANLRDARRG